MPLFDFKCACGFEWPDHYVSKDRKHVPCPHCGAEMDKIWTGGFPNVRDDSIPGGLTIENLAPTPQTFYSHSEKKLYLKMHGIREKVQHVGLQGSDKSPHTVRWACPPAVLTPEDEAKRVERWHEHENELKCQ